MDHKKLSLALIIVLGILLAASTLALAQRATPPLAPGQSAGMDPAAIVLGQPGLSYRYVKSIGTLGVPYKADTTHLNRPQGLFIDKNDNLYITEELGSRVLKYDSNKVNKLALGVPGLCEGDDRGFCNPRDVAVDKEGNFWVVDPHRVVQYSPAGTYLQQFPAIEPWRSGPENDRFDDPNGVAFDSAGRMYVSDTWNQRIQVFDMSSGTPVYSATIGVTDVISSTPGYFSEPLRIAIDLNDRLYVVDHRNNRVQKCVFSSGWSCTILDDTLNFPRGIATDNAGNVYIADSNNGRIRKCTSAGSCSNFVQWWGFQDVAVDTDGNVYGSDSWGAIIDQFNPSGEWQGIYLGVGQTPYLTDKDHFFHPRVAIDSQDNILILEENGQRLVKLDKDGNFLWAFGVPGVDGDDDAHLANPHGLATDSSGKIYVANGCQVKVFSPAGAYLKPLGTGCGTGNFQFSWVTGVDVDRNGNIYVADYHNHRVQVYNNSLDYIGRIGVTGECGAANDHLCTPIGVETDAAGNIYIADGGNNRLQKFNSSRQWQMTIGGTWGEAFDQFAWPEDVAVDAQGRIFVADWSNRVQVFDPAGKYLTTIGGAWGKDTSQFNALSGVDIDSKGNVYVADWDNFLIKVFAPGYPGWQQANINGFGNRWNNHIINMEVFEGKLYAGTSNWADGYAAQVWRTADGQTWQQSGETGLGAAYLDRNKAVIDFGVFDGKLYASTGWGGQPGQIWRTGDGFDWTLIEDNGFDTPGNSAITMFAVYADMLYAAATGSTGDGVEIWRSSTGNAGSWTRVVENGHDNANSNFICDLLEFNDHLYAMLENPNEGAQIWQTSDGLSWTEVITQGFGIPANIQTGGAAVFQGELYVGTRNQVSGGEIWRSADGMEWERMMNGGFGDPGNKKIEHIFTAKGQLFASTENSQGAQLWRSLDGVTWKPAMLDEFGNSNNGWVGWSGIEFLNRIFLGIGDDYGASGSKVWEYIGFPVYLPLVRR